MYIVMVKDKKHSAWLTLEGALNQRRVLQANGYKGVFVEKDETVH